MKTNYSFIKVLLVLMCFTAQNTSAQCTCTVTSTQPCIENFSGLTLNDQLPPCWAASNMSVTCLTFATPPNQTRGAFFDNPAGVNYFYTNGIYLLAGVTYSADLWYRTSMSGSNWTDLSILYGTSQSPVGHTLVASTNGPANSAVYTSLSNTFAVSSTGQYFFSVRGTSTVGISNYLSWDDLRISLPCSAGNNAPTMTMTPASASVCAGASSSFTVTGADSYTWSTGATGSVVTVTFPGGTSMGSFTVTGTKTLTQCSSILSPTQNIYPSPVVNAVSVPAEVCSGSSVTLLAAGDAGNSYVWVNGGPSTAAYVVYPASPVTNYSVIGTNTYGCSKMALVSVQVHNRPVVVPSSSNFTVCIGDQVIVTASGAPGYTWVSSTSAIGNGTVMALSPSVSATYSIFGEDTHGCRDTATVAFVVDACTGLSNAGNSQVSIKIFPNPSNGIFTIEYSGVVGPDTKVLVFNNLGQKVAEHELSTRTTQATLNLAPGIYVYMIGHSGNTFSSGKLMVE